MAACPDIPDPDIPAMPELSAWMAHVLSDIHDISARLARLELLIDEFAPLARQAAGRFRLKNLGRRADARP